MAQPIEYSFMRFLESKRSVDERALNAAVREALAGELRRRDPQTPLDVLEIGAGTGIMLERLLEWELFCNADYTALDISAEYLAEARRRLPRWAAGHGYCCTDGRDGRLLISKNGRVIRLSFEEAELCDYLRRTPGPRWDVLVAHAFLDLIDIPATLPRLLAGLRPGGLFYFTINFDGETILEPLIDAALDAQIMALYHRTMDERTLDGRPSGDSRSGRRLFAQLTAAGASVPAAGASDWVVHPRGGVYPHDEAYFLHYIIETIRLALAGRPELDAHAFASWIAARHAQVERGELVYIAHQLDFVGYV